MDMRMKLLIIEDNPQMRRMIRAVVADLAEAISECDDGDEAVAAYAAHRGRLSRERLAALWLPQ
jgi:CheY-like chemotaxis protein